MADGRIRRGGTRAARHRSGPWQDACAWARWVSWGTLVVVLMAGWGGRAAGQDRFGCQNAATDPVRCFDLQLFVPTHSSGTTFTIDRPDVLRHLSLEFGIAGSLALSLLDRNVPGGSGNEDVVGSLVQGEILAALGLFEVVELGLALPVALIDAAEDVSADPLTLRRKFSLADIRLSVKAPILRGDFALAGMVYATIPTGDSDEFVSGGYWTLMPMVVASGKLGPVTLGGELGYRLRRLARLGNLEQDDELELSFGANWTILEQLALLVETQLRVGVGGGVGSSVEVPWDANLGVRWKPNPSISVDVGVGRGIGVTDGYGAPSFRAFGIFRYATAPDRCDAGPEDYDGFEDGDYCADPDNDNDGLLDTQDVCPNDPEDMDDFFDRDGCPDVDNDADGVSDVEDECPLRSEDLDGYQDQDGCPEPDNDEDGVPDGIDECPMDPEDRDRYEDDDGCPEPGPGRATVTVTERRILISERIYFDFDRDTIRSVSQPLLEQVAAAIQRLNRRRRIRVEGFTDSEGDDEYNRDLSYRRARSVVQYLIDQGVSRRRLEYEGYGEVNPVAPNDSPEGRALNRRVEFTILEPGE